MHSSRVMHKILAMHNILDIHNILAMLNSLHKQDIHSSLHNHLMWYSSSPNQANTHSTQATRLCHRMHSHNNYVSWKTSHGP